MATEDDDQLLLASLVSLLQKRLSRIPPSLFHLKNVEITEFPAWCNEESEGAVTASDFCESDLWRRFKTEVGREMEYVVERGYVLIIYL